MKLDVYVGGQLVGYLSEGHAASSVFTYAPDAAPARLVSLTMPVRDKSYEYHRGPHPVFQMNLPEGYKKDLLRQTVGPHADTSDLGLLVLTGANGIGRIQVVPAGRALWSIGSREDMASVLASADSRESLLKVLQSDIYEGVSGVMPKSFAAEQPTEPDNRVTAQTPGWILKTGSTSLPWIAINEYLCLEVARAAGLNVPQARLSDDGQVLAVKRFDRLDDGGMLAFEDFCSLAGLLPADKYNGTGHLKASMESMTGIIKERVALESRSEDMARLFTLHLINYALRNGDAHLKNFGLLYTTENDARLSPVFDIVTVTVYPHLLRDSPALTLAGKKTWSCGKDLHDMAGKTMQLTPYVRTRCLEAVQNAVQAVLPEVQEKVEQFPEFRETAKLMLIEWAKGLEDIKPTAKPGKIDPPAPLEEQIGLSGPKGVVRKEVNPYKNKDGAFSHKAR